ncbi:hypothetical protein C8A05DRAFT_30449 [Staphylotrichum tortipilum]|uniref:Myb-like domain-containing protein n=1 Tax=Staphylotrichum tortipilum TaxID=2831512 RepID=A0AAN6MSA2_9PEZI|nr:hypothetical protein C8A05DRAFT_30449 [Staphylotrichum longicolle]
MDSDSDASSGPEIQDTSRLRDSVSMVLRQVQQHQQTKRPQSGEIPESDEEEADDRDVEESNEFITTEVHGNEDDDDFDEPPPRRLSFSDGSQYSPSVASDDVPPDQQHPLKPEPNPPEPTSRASRAPPLRLKPPFSPYSTVPPTPTQWASPRKRSLSPLPGLGLASPRPFKRHKSAPFNAAYLGLLNEDILDAASGFIPNDDLTAATPASTLPASQAGLTHWSGAEKILLYSALARLGRDDIVGIAARIRTKSELEVAAYLTLLGESKGRTKDGANIVPADIPAAVELSQACCAALEQAADALSLRQEAHEEAAEKKRWGDQCWLIGQANYRDVEAMQEQPLALAMEMFRMRNWLELSERVFMNAAVEEYNWESVADETPAIRATALQDFYALAVEMTRRLVAATIFVAESRIKARRLLYPDARSRVWTQDVEAAVLSLGLPANSRMFWAKSARRLRLAVLDDEDADEMAWDGEGEQELMTYDEVEAALELKSGNMEDVSDDDSDLPSSDDEESAEDTASLSGSDYGSVDLGAGSPSAPKLKKPDFPKMDETEKAAIKREMNEVFVHSALEYPTSKTNKKSLRDRICAERAHEAYADKLDAKASYSEEKRLWALLGKEPPMELAKPEVPEQPPKHSKRRVDELVGGFARVPGDWRSKLEAVPSRWEMEYAVVQEEKAEAAARAESTSDI